MTQRKILEELKKCSPKDRLEIIEAAIRLLRDDLHHIEQPWDLMERKHQLAAAAADRKSVV